MTPLRHDDLMPSRAAVVLSRPAPDDRSRLVATVVVVVLIAAAVLPLASLAGGGHAFWPARWDARIAPIAARDTELRGLTFEHPVSVLFLSDKAFVRLLRTQSGGVSVSDRVQVDREAATFRALGLIGGNVDLVKAFTTADEAGELAFYDPARKEIVVRGDSVDVSHRATLAHELTHVLQDQHFDLSAIQNRSDKADSTTGGSSGAATALIEGDANHVRDLYVKGLSKADRAEYAREQESEQKQNGSSTAGVPPFVELLFGAPYEYGPLAVRVLIASGGENAVNAALTGPTPTSAFLVESGLLDPAPLGLEAPAVLTGETADGPPESFGALETYLTLAMRIDPTIALTAADTVLGGRARGVMQGQTYCYRATVETRDAAGATFLAGIERQWAASGVGSKVDQSGTSVTLIACDPGKRAVGPSKQRVDQVGTLLDVRASLTATVAEDHVGADNARCIGRVITSQPGLLSVLEESLAQLTTAQKARLQSLGASAALRCRSDPNAGLE